MALLLALLAVKLLAFRAVQGGDSAAAVAKQIPYCSGSSRLKGANQAFDLCPITDAGYHVICPEIPFFLAATACADFGWRLAIPTVEAVDEILSVYGNCTTAPYLWLGGYNGYQQDPCMVLTPEGVAAAGLSQCESLGQAGVLCQEIPVLTVTTTATFTTPTTYGVTTETVATFDPAHCHKPPAPPSPCQHCLGSSSSSSSDSSNSDGERPCRQCASKSATDPALRIEKSGLQAPECPVVCALEVGNLHLVLDATNVGLAAEVCQSYGWTLADLTTGTYDAAYQMIQQCASQDSTVWINSYNGINSTCVGLFREPGIVAEPLLAFVLEQSVCVQRLGSVLCQDQAAPPAVTGSGAWLGSVSVVVEPTTVEVIVTYPSSTRTVTSFAPTPFRVRLQ